MGKIKTKEIEELAKLKQQKSLSEEKRQEIKKIAYNNFINAISILIFLITLMVIPLFTEQKIVILIYKISSIIILLFSIFLIEKAYKKDDGMVAISGIEILILSVIVLYAPYGFVKLQSNFLQLSGTYYAIYYIIKTITLYISEKKKYLAIVSDIPEIVKRESKDKIKIEKQEEEKKLAKQKEKSSNLKKQKKFLKQKKKK